MEKIYKIKKYRKERRMVGAIERRIQNEFIHGCGCTWEGGGAEKEGV